MTSMKTSNHGNVHQPTTVEGPAEFERPAGIRPLEHVIEESANRAARPSHSLRSGRTLEARSVSDTEDLITVRGVSGDVELEVRMTPDGPLLRFKSADVRLESAGEVRVDCERFHVNAKDGIVEETGGDFHRRVAGDASVEIKGDLHERARVVNIGARRGDVRIRANDDVRLNGERVKLNCALPEA